MPRDLDLLGISRLDTDNVRKQEWSFMESVIIGIDLGGTNLRIGAVTPDNEMLTPSVIRSSVVAEAPRPIEKICEIIEEYKKENKIENVEAISIGVPSSVEMIRKPLSVRQIFVMKRGGGLHTYKSGERYQGTLSDSCIYQ